MYKRQESDYDVYFTYLSNKESAVEVEKLGTNGQIVKGIQCDISQFENVVDCFSIIKNNTSKLDVLVNNAGASYDELLINMSNSIWDNSIALNLNGAFYCLNNADVYKRQGILKPSIAVKYLLSCGLFFNSFVKCFED